MLSNDGTQLTERTHRDNSDAWKVTRPMRSDTTEPTTTEEARLPSDGVRSILSLLLIIHLFCALVGVCYVAQPSSPLHRRLLTFFGPYIELFNFDVDATPYYQTSYVDPGEEFAEFVDESAGSRIEILPVGKDEADSQQWVSYPDVGFRGGERYKRYQRLARRVTEFDDDERLTALVASGFGTSFLFETDTEPYKIRCRNHRPVRREWLSRGSAEQRDASEEMHFLTVYQATAVVSGDGVVEVVRDSQPQESTTTRSQTDAPTGGDNPQ